MSVQTHVDYVYILAATLIYLKNNRANHSLSESVSEMDLFEQESQGLFPRIYDIPLYSCLLNMSVKKCDRRAV